MVFKGTIHICLPHSFESFRRFPEVWLKGALEATIYFILFFLKRKIEGAELTNSDYKISPNSTLLTACLSAQSRILVPFTRR